MLIDNRKKGESTKLWDSTIGYALAVSFFSAVALISIGFSIGKRRGNIGGYISFNKCHVHYFDLLMSEIIIS